jgi:hypothetical protein
VTLPPDTDDTMSISSARLAPEASLILSIARSTDIAKAVARVPPPDMVTITSVSGSSPGARDFHS